MKKRNNISNVVKGLNKSPNKTIVKIKTETSGWGLLKTLTVAMLIALQIGFLIYLYIRFSFAFNWFMIINSILSVLTCIYVLASNKNGLSKAVWIIFILLGVSFGYVIYWLSDERIFFARAKKRFKKVFLKGEKYKSQLYDVKVKDTSVKCDINYLKRAGNFNAHLGNKLTYFSSGTEAYDDIIERLKQAKKFIFIEFFIVSDGVLLDRITDILQKKVKEGVEVRLIYDDMGSHRSLSLKTKRRLRNMGIKIKPFNRLVPLFAVIMNYRDHRKIISIDGETVYTGGINLADEYVNEKRMYGYWKDNGIRIDGSAVDEFTIMFLRQWEFLGKIEEDYDKFLNQYKRDKGDGIIVPYADGLDYEQPIGKSVYENIIMQAQEKIYIMTPYFITDDTMMQLIKNKALSGVDVRIILPEIPDKGLVYGVSRNNAEKLIDSGVKVYTMTNCFVHTKAVLSEKCVSTGSVNMDLRSFYQQFECAVYSNDINFMKEVEKDFTSSLKICKRITDGNKWRKNVFYRLLTAFMQVFAPFM